MKSIFAILFFCLTLCACEKSSQPKIGIVLPIEHKALQEIVRGFTETLKKSHPELEIKVMNAQGDINIQRAILQQMQDQNYSMVIPVATGVTEMAIATIHNKPIIGLAADFLEHDRQQLKNCNLAIVRDAIPQERLIQFFHMVYPNISELVLIHSSTDKIYPDVKDVIEAAKRNNIHVRPIMVTTLPELVAATQSLSTHTQGIFILKDSLIASGISTLIKTANTRHIPLFTSDQSTVELGAGFSLGVKERTTGEEGAKLVEQLLQTKKSACQLPIVPVEKFMIFVNQDALKREQQSFLNIEMAAKKMGYTLQLVNQH